MGICISLYENNEFEEARKYSKYLTEVYNYTNKDKQSLSNHLYFISDYLYLNGNFLEGRKYLINAVKKYPKNIKFLLKAFISLFGQDIYNIILKYYKNAGKKQKKINIKSLFNK